MLWVDCETHKEFNKLATWEVKLEYGNREQLKVIKEVRYIDELISNNNVSEIIEQLEWLIQKYEEECEQECDDAKYEIQSEYEDKIDDVKDLIYTLENPDED